MRSPLGKLFYIIFAILILFIATEIALEIRAIRRGWNGIWIEGVNQILKLKNSKGENSVLANPNNDIYPITRNPFVRKKREGSNRPLRIVVVGTSHSEDVRMRMEDLWVNQMGNRLREIGERESLQNLVKTEVINASWSGSTLTSLYPRIKWVLKEYRPDVVIIYELSNSINEYCWKIRYGMSEKSLEKSQQDENLTIENQSSYSLLEILGLRRMVTNLLGKTSLYEHLKSIIGAQMVDFMFKKDEIGPQAEQWYYENLAKYAALCQQHNTLLVLSEFLVGVDEKSGNHARLRQIKGCFRYNSLLTVKGWLNTVTQLNQRTQKFSEQYSLPFISVRNEVGCDKEYFRDFVHFTKKGHKVMGRAMADAFAGKYLKQLGRKDKNEF